MKTPAGVECPFYYADYHRGKQKEECRLIARNPEGGRWHARLCHTCPVPAILRQNACEHLVLEGRVERTWFGLREQVHVYAVCAKHLLEVQAPEVGCGHCHDDLARWLEQSLLDR